jgi:hypothetical protein
MDEKEFAKSVAMDAAIVRKSLNNLMGIVNGLVCDNQLPDTEIHYLATWLEQNREIADEYPANIVFRRVREVLADGVITDEERAELLADLKPPVAGTLATRRGTLRAWTHQPQTTCSSTPWTPSC